MRHRIIGRTLNRTTSHRKAMRRNMAISLFQHEAIRTTEAKAKELRPFVEKLITMARKDTLHARRLISAELGNRRGKRGRMYADGEEEPMDQRLLQKIFGEIAPRYADRPGGYTRIIRLAERRIGDAGQQVVLQLVETTGDAGGAESATRSRRRKRAQKRHEAVEAAIGAEETPAQDAPPAAEEPTEAAPESEAPASEGDQAGKDA